MEKARDLRCFGHAQVQGIKSRVDHQQHPVTVAVTIHDDALTLSGDSLSVFSGLIQWQGLTGLSSLHLLLPFCQPGFPSF